MNETDALKRDEQLGTEELGEAFGAQQDNRLKQLHTSMPAIVVSFDPATQTCVVQPATQRVFSGTPRDLPVCVDCPVQFPQGGGVALTFPIVPGDEVLLVLAERAIDNWFASGGTQPPSEYRMHDLSDGFAVPGIRNQTRNLPAFNMVGAELRLDDSSAAATLALDGTVTLRNGAGSIVLGADGTVVINAPAGLQVNGPQTNSSTIDASGNVTAPDVIAGGKSGASHFHVAQGPTSPTTPPRP